jgi:hypothetical protein
MEIQITAIKFETVDGKKTGRSFLSRLILRNWLFTRLRQLSRRKLRNMWLIVASSRKKNWMM